MINQTIKGRDETVRLDTIRPAPVNDLIYRPVDPSDPGVQDLARDIERQGLLERIVITTDNVILSGHRRAAACRLANLDTVPVRRVAVLSTDPGFVGVLTSHNLQRVKGVDEVIREELSRTDPATAFARLVEQRAEASRVKVETLEVTDIGRRCRISKAKVPFLTAMREVIDAERAYWPLSDRKVHYLLLNDPPLRHASKPESVYRNDLASYKDLTGLLTRARLVGTIPFEAIADPTRTVTTWDVHAAAGPFIRRCLDGFLAGYYRDLMRTQPLHIEIVGEKNTIASVVREVAVRYTMPFTIGRGYASLPPRQEMAQRFRRSGKCRLLVLFVSDFDPEGRDIPKSFLKSMRRDFGVTSAEGVQVALTPAQIRTLNLIPSMTVKKKSSRANAYVAEHGEHVFELEAVPSATLAGLIDDAVRSVIDVDLFNAERDAEAGDAGEIEAFRKTVLSLLPHRN